MRTILNALILTAILIAGAITVYQADKAIKYYEWVYNLNDLFVRDIDNPTNCIYDRTCTLTIDDSRVVVMREYKYVTIGYYLDPRWIKEGVSLADIEKFIAKNPL